MEAKEKTIYDLQEHESMLVDISINGINELGKGGRKGAIAYPYVWQVTRVATGWIYQNANTNIKHSEGYFVPLPLSTNNTKE